MPIVKQHLRWKICCKGRLLYLNWARAMLEVVQARLAKKEKKVKKSVVCWTVCQVSLHSAALVLSGISSNTVGLAHSSLFLMPFNLCLLSEVEDSSLSLSPSILHLYIFFFHFLICSTVAFTVLCNPKHAKQPKLHSFDQGKIAVLLL